jgi:hypothetical protein
MNAPHRTLLAFAILASSVQATWASPYCCEGKTDMPLAEQFDEAKIVMIGHFTNAKLAPTDVNKGTTDLVIDHVFKDHPMIQGKGKVTLPRYINDEKTKFLVFCDVFNDKLDAYKGVPLVDEGELRKYVDGVMKLKGKPQPERLRFAFDFLTSPENTVAMDAYWEFARADYRDYKEIAKKLDADKIAGWLKDPKTPNYRYGLYGTLLGHCGNAKHGEFLMTMIKDADRRKYSGMQGLIMGYIMIEPEKGWKYLKDFSADKEQTWGTRYAGLTTMRFLYEARSDVIAKDEAAARKEIVTGMLGVMSVPDIADLAIENLRKWRRWECCGAVLDVFSKKDFDSRYVRRAVLRYALQCPEPAARNFVEAQRKVNRDWVEETKENLDLETR